LSDAMMIRSLVSSRAIVNGIYRDHCYGDGAKDCLAERWGLLSFLVSGFSYVPKAGPSYESRANRHPSPSNKTRWSKNSLMLER
jgi:hypothetical protein